MTTSDLSMPLTGLGTYPLSGERCKASVTAGLELGYRHIDTAQMYRNERAVGEGIRASGVARTDIFLTTKIWPSYFRSKEFLKAFDQSLHDLDIDHVDLLLLHWPQVDVPLAETLGALRELVASGKVRHGGVSNFSVQQLTHAKDIAGDAVSHTQFECYVGSAPVALIKAARKLGLHLTAYSPLGRGALVKNRQLTTIAARYGVSAAQVALRWLTQQDITVIPKASSRERLAENLAAERFMLSDDDIAVLGHL